MKAWFHHHIVVFEVAYLKCRWLNQVYDCLKDCLLLGTPLTFFWWRLPLTISCIVNVIYLIIKLWLNWNSLLYENSFDPFESCYSNQIIFFFTFLTWCSAAKLYFLSIWLFLIANSQCHGNFCAVLRRRHAQMDM